MILDITPLRKYRDYRLLYTGQLVSLFGSMVTTVAVPGAAVQHHPIQPDGGTAGNWYSWLLCLFLRCWEGPTPTAWIGGGFW